MKIRIKFFLIAICAIGMLGVAGCSNHQERYEEPPWLGGSSIETLEEEGNYNTFIALMKKANYYEPVSKQLFTLFVPSDDAFEAYFNKIGKSSVDEFTKDEAVRLFALHILRNPRSRFLLIYEYVYNEFQGPDQGHNGEYMSLFHRKQTPSTTTPYTETVRYYTDMVGEEVLMTSGEKNVPLFTDEWFHDFGSFDPKGDYLYMYPESQWREGYESDMPGTNWHSAMVLPHVNEAGESELEVRTASGFIYYIDRVVEPMPSIDEYLKKTEKYSLYYDILQRFATYSSGGTTADGRSLYEKGYDLVYNLADETAGSAVSDFPQDMYSAFIPNDQLLQEYLDNKILATYGDIDNVPQVTLFYLLQSHLSSEVTLMSKMEKTFFNSFGDNLEMSREDLYEGFMCSNGVIYETKKIMEPNVFTTVPGALFFEKDYSTLLFVLNQADVLINLSDPAKKVTLIASTNEQLEAYGVRYDEDKAEIQFRSPANDEWSAMGEENLIEFAQNQIIMSDDYSSFSGDGFIETASGNYISYSNNKLQGAENMSSGVIANVEEVIQNEKNGYLIKASAPIQSRYRMDQFLTDDPEVSIFYNMLSDLKILVRKRDDITKEKYEEISFFAGADTWTSLIPTNDAMMTAIDEGIIPDVTAGGRWHRELSFGALDSLKDWIDYHFLRDNIVLTDGINSGEFETNNTYPSEDGTTTLFSKVIINNEPNNFSIQDETGQEIVVDQDDANILIQMGVVHKLDTVLKLYE